MRHFDRCVVFVAIVLACVVQAQDVRKPIVVGGKKDTEGRVLSEVLAQLIEARTEIPVQRRTGLGGTMICFGALVAGEIDLYPEYTGTGLVGILKREPSTDPLQTFLEVQEAHRQQGLLWLRPFGFNNTYALAMREAQAEELGIRRVSDLAAHIGTLEVGVSLEFLNRKDGWPGLAEAYGLEPAALRGMEHGLAYAAIQGGDIDVIDAYSTDGKLLRYQLRVLEDDRQFFPPYHAAPLVRADALEAHPQLRAVLGELAFRIDADEVQHLNSQLEEKRPLDEVARGFLKREGLLDAPVETSAPPQGFWALMRSRWKMTLVLTGQHLELTLLSVLLATLVSIPLGIACTRWPISTPVLVGAGVIQTIPSLALLAIMLPLFGIGEGPAVVALFLYALLPIVRNTYTGIREVDADLVEAARGMGLTDAQILWHVELPLATRTIMAGVRTSTVISVGVATIAAFIGAGGLGEPIVTGLNLDDHNLVLAGAIPAALLAIVVDLLLAGIERILVPRGLA